jgi:hypothetical protein
MFVKDPLPGPVLSQLNLVHNLIPYSFKVILIISFHLYLHFPFHLHLDFLHSFIFSHFFGRSLHEFLTLQYPLSFSNIFLNFCLCFVNKSAIRAYCCILTEIKYILCIVHICVESICITEFIICKCPRTCMSAKTTNIAQKLEKSAVTYC